MKADANASPYSRVVIDTNVLLSAALVPTGAPATLVDRLLQHGRLIFSPATFSEIESRIWKPKFDRYLSIEMRKRLLHDLSASAFWVVVPPGLLKQRFSRDAEDDAFVHAALAAEASRLVSGDDDLLVLQKVEFVTIVSPRAALNELARA